MNRINCSIPFTMYDIRVQRNCWTDVEIEAAKTMMTFNGTAMKSRESNKRIVFYYNGKAYKYI